MQDKEETAKAESISFSEYLDVDVVNNSRLKAMGTSPLHYLTYPYREQRDTASKKLGRPIHTAVLEPEKFDKSIEIWSGGFTQRGEPTMSKNSTDYKQLIERATLEGREVMDQGQASLCLDVQHHVWAHRVANKLLAKPAEAEISVFWTHRFGIKCKARIDILNAGKYLADLKSAVDITQDVFGRAAYKFEYHVQGAFYQDSVEVLTGKKLPYYIVAVEKQAPFDVVVYEVPDHVLDLGRDVYEQRLMRVVECTKTGMWPGVCGSIAELELPHWAYSEEEGRITMPDGTGVSA